MSLQSSWNEAVAHHQAGVKDVLLVEYRCRKKGCLLLHVWQAPKGLEFFAPAARVSDQFVSAGQWHWLGYNREDEKKTGDRAGRLDEVAARLQSGGWLWLMCEHVKESMWVRDIRQDAASGQLGQPTTGFFPRATRPQTP